MARVQTNQMKGTPAIYVLKFMVTTLIWLFAIGTIILR